MVAVLKIIATVLWVMGWAAAGWPVAWLSGAKADARIMWMMQRCFSGVLRIVGVRLERVGRLCPLRPLLLVSNHTTYLDIAVLGASAPVHFTPKTEIADWPLIGMCSRLLRSIFIDRRISKTGENRRNLRDALAAGKVISLFPEGTTNDGKRLHPFRSSYFSLAEERFGGAALTVQPAAIVYTHINGLPIDSTQWPLVAWYGDMNMLTHARRLLSLGSLRAKIVFGAPISVDDLNPDEPSSRKALAAQCERAVQDLLRA